MFLEAILEVGRNFATGGKCRSQSHISWDTLTCLIGSWLFCNYFLWSRHHNASENLQWVVCLHPQQGTLTTRCASGSLTELISSSWFLTLPNLMWEGSLKCSSGRWRGVSPKFASSSTRPTVSPPKTWWGFMEHSSGAWRHSSMSQNLLGCTSALSGLRNIQ